LKIKLRYPVYFLRYTTLQIQREAHIYSTRNNIHIYFARLFETRREETHRYVCIDR